MKLKSAIDALDRDLRRFQVDINKYFAGALELPPEGFEKELAERIRNLRGRRNNSSVIQFRLNGLTDRFRSLRELFHRRLREEERGARGRPGDGGPADADVRNGVVLGSAPAPEALRALYDALYEERARSTPFDTFRNRLIHQLDSIRTRTGCSEVRFRVDASGNRPRLKALPLDQEDP